MNAGTAPRTPRAAGATAGRPRPPPPRRAARAPGRRRHPRGAGRASDRRAGCSRRHRDHSRADRRPGEDARHEERRVVLSAHAGGQAGRPSALVTELATARHGRPGRRQGGRAGPRHAGLRTLRLHVSGRPAPARQPRSAGALLPASPRYGSAAAGERDPHRMSSAPGEERLRSGRCCRMKFVHAADLHIDSPLRGLDRYPGAPVEQIRGRPAARSRTSSNLCLAEEVDLLLLAGDIYDGDWKDYSTGLLLRRAALPPARRPGGRRAPLRQPRRRERHITSPGAPRERHGGSIPAAPESIVFERLGSRRPRHRALRQRPSPTISPPGYSGRARRASSTSACSTPAWAAARATTTTLPAA